MAKKGRRARPVNGSRTSREGLTTTHASIVWSASDDYGPSSQELDDIAVQRLIDTLAEIVISVARRNTGD